MDLECIHPRKMEGNETPELCAFLRFLRHFLVSDGAKTLSKMSLTYETLSYNSSRHIHSELMQYLLTIDGLFTGRYSITSSTPTSASAFIPIFPMANILFGYFLLFEIM